MTPAPRISAVRAGAEGLAAHLPQVLAEAGRLADLLAMGAHARRRPGLGSDFWQYRPARPGDLMSTIDARRSARADSPFVREREWQGAGQVTIWCDRARSMGFRGQPGRATKADRAAVLALALAILLLRGGERVALWGQGAPVRGVAGVTRLARDLTLAGDAEAVADYGAPDPAGVAGMPLGSQALMFSDFMGDPQVMEEAIAQAAARGIRGVLVQVLDPDEETFPFAGRSIFSSMAGRIEHETMDAAALAQAYRARLAERRDRLVVAARRAGWLVLHHRTDQPALGALLWLIGALEARQ